MTDKPTLAGELTALAAKATPPLWIAYGGEIAHADGPALWGKPGGKQEIANVALAVALVNRFPTIIAALAANDEAARLRGALESIIRHYEQETRDGNAPGHGHRVAGIWDDTGNAPELAGEPCEWCAQWKLARAALNATVDGGVK